MALGINVLETKSFPMGFIHPENMKTFSYTAGASQTLKKFSPVAVKTSDSKLYALDTTKSDGTQTLVGVICEDVTVAASSTATVEVAVVCELAHSAVPSGVTFAAGVYNYGNIIVRDC